MTFILLLNLSTLQKISIMADISILKDVCVCVCVCVCVLILDS